MRRMMFSSSRTLPPQEYSTSRAVVSGESCLLQPYCWLNLARKRAARMKDLLFAISQRGDANLHNVQAVIEILAELSPSEWQLKVPIRRGDDRMSVWPARVHGVGEAFGWRRRCTGGSSVRTTRKERNPGLELLYEFLRSLRRSVCGSTIASKERTAP